jgi:hypothetical protein
LQQQESFVAARMLCVHLLESTGKDNQPACAVVINHCIMIDAATVSAVVGDGLQAKGFVQSRVPVIGTNPLGRVRVAGASVQLTAHANVS